MNKKALRQDTVYAIITFLSLFYMNYYQTKIYYTSMTQYTNVLDIIYGDIAIPFFYFFIAAFITTVILYFIRISLAKTLCKILKYIVGIAIILYIVMVLAKLIGIINIPVIGFIPLCLIVICVLGGLFALVSYDKHKEAV